MPLPTKRKSFFSSGKAKKRKRNPLSNITNQLNFNASTSSNIASTSTVTPIYIAVADHDITYHQDAMPSTSAAIASTSSATTIYIGATNQDILVLPSESVQLDVEDQFDSEDESILNIVSEGIDYITLRDETNSVRQSAEYRRNHSGNFCKCAVISVENFADNVISEYATSQVVFHCSHCQAFYFHEEKTSTGLYSKCCNQGNISLDPIEIPECLKELYTNQDANGKHFREHIRKYNSGLSFASFKAGFCDLGAGYYYNVHGMVYHSIGPLRPSAGCTPSHNQLYFYDVSEASERRMHWQGRADACKIEVMDKLSECLHQVSPYAAVFKTMRDVVNTTDRLSSTVMYILRNKQRTYNTSTAKFGVDVAFKTSDGEPPDPDHIDLVVHEQGGGLKKINILSEHCDPLVYSLLFPLGTRGWTTGMDQLNATGRTRTSITMLQFYSYRCHIRDQESCFSPLFVAGKLFHQFICDAYLKVEMNNLNYLRKNQSVLRVSNYSGLQDYVANLADQNCASVGKIHILPSTFQGSPRNMRLAYMDAMSYVGRYGKPDFFITFTCNPNWVEITNNLLPGQKYNDRPDLVSRVFKIYLKELMCDLTKRHVVGVTIADLHVIEFQKRGLPHAHIVLFLQSADKLHTSADIDRVVSAEIPDINKSPKLYHMVQKHMVHGPCGNFNMNSPCMDEGKCTKRYPMDYIQDTVYSCSGFPKYKRPFNGRAVSINGVHYGNMWIVPYNPYLLSKYNCHLNVEVCSSTKSIKYLFKYIHKGYDKANLALSYPNRSSEVDYDEITKYINTRYISAPEAAWHLFKFPMSEICHVVHRLAVHLENDHSVFFREGNEVNAVTNGAARFTTLTSFFHLNRSRHPVATQLKYLDMPKYFWFVNKQTGWQLRKNHCGDIISRMFDVSLKAGECYYLRLILFHVTNVTSHEDVRCVNGLQFDTFKEAAAALNLIGRDSEWDECLTEASAYRMPHALRSLFALILHGNDPCNAVELWEKHKISLCEDFLRSQQRHDPCLEINANIEARGLTALNKCLNKYGVDISKYGFNPIPDHISTETTDTTVYDLSQQCVLGDQMLSKLTAEQRDVVDTVLTAVDAGETYAGNKLIFLNAPGGCGKTFVYKSLMHVLRGRGLHTIACAFSGIAALLLPGGRTMHSVFKLPLALNETSVSNIAVESPLAQEIMNCSVFIFDECSMIPKQAMKAVDLLFRDLLRNDTPFGGKIVLVGGDFRQILPVVFRGGRVQIMEKCLKNLNTWHLFQEKRLTRNLRADEHSQDFANWLLTIGNGTAEVLHDLGQDYIHLPNQIVLNSPDCNGEALVKEIYGDISNIMTNDDPSHFLKGRAILTPVNRDVDTINHDILDKWPGISKTYHSADSYEDEVAGDNYRMPIEYLHTLTPSGLPPHNLRLKVGVIVILIRSINTNIGLCNGARLIITGLGDRFLTAKIVGTEFDGNVVFLPRLILNTSQEDVVNFTRRQFPIRLAFCLTINKSQGQTLDKVGLLLPRPVFSHGQLYVAFSRVRNFESLKVQILSRDNNTSKQHTRNVVYREVL